MSLEGQQIGRYRLLRLLGSSGMDEVYLAEDAPINRQVAIKVIRVEVSPHPGDSAVKEATLLFQREARAIATLDHPHILPLYDYGEVTINGAPLAYLVMPYRPEGSLTAWLPQPGSSELPQRMPLHTQDVAHFIHQAAGALQHAHDRQIIHQDVRPANFLIRSDTENPDRPDLLLANFSVAKIITATASTSHSIHGTPPYMAPEQLDGHPVPASDQYALAVMAYELLTGRPPFQNSHSQVTYQHLQAQLPRGVDTVLLHALAKKPEDRFTSISAFERAFQEALQGTDTPTIISTGLRNTLPLTDPSDNSAGVHAALAISDIEARRGTSRTLTLPGGRQVTVTVPAGAHDGQVIYLTDQGEITSQGSWASLILTITVTSTQQHQAIVPDPGQSTVNNASTVLSNQTQNRPIDQSSPIAPFKRRGLPGSSAALLVGLALLVILGGLGAVLLLTRQNGSTTTNVPAGQLKVAATTTATTAQNNPVQSNANANATATAQANPTSPPVPSSNPYPPNAGTLVLNDPLIDNSKGYQWDQGTNSNNATCQFTANGLDVTQPKQGYFHGCIAHSTDFTNFAYEVQMTMLSGDYAGIIFCADTTRGTYYFFYIQPAGDYALRTVSNNRITGTLKSGSSPAIHTSPDATNLIAAVVQNGSINLYVNRTLIDSVRDSSYTHGAIGLFTGSRVNAAVTVFSSAKVWSL
jgi:serine/threonine protein kinase